jgi:hypothetical protein
LPAARVVGAVREGLIQKDLGWDSKKGLKVCGNDLNHISSDSPEGLNCYDLLL